MPERVLRKYGEQAIIDFTLFDTNNENFKTDATHETGDTKISKDEGGEINTTNGFVDNGTGYSLTLSAAEMSAKRIFVPIVDQYNKQWRDEYLMIETFGHTDAQQAFNLDADLSDNNETWNFKAIDIHNDAGFGLRVESDTTTAIQLRAGGNGDGLDSSGCGTGHAFNLRAGARGHAISAVAIGVEGTDGHGIYTESESDGYGIQCLGGARAGESSGYGANIEARNGHQGLRVKGAPGQSGVLFQGGTGGHGMSIQGDGGGHGLWVEGGSSNGNGIYTQGKQGGSGIYAVTSGGTGSGIYARCGPGGTGHGLFVKGGDSSGSGMYVESTFGHAMYVNSIGGGYGGLLVRGGSGASGMKITSSGGGVAALHVVGNYAIRAEGTGGSGRGLTIDAGTSAGTGIYVQGGTSTGRGIYVRGYGTTQGILVQGGGVGFQVDGGSVYSAMLVKSSNGHGLELSGGASSRDLYAGEIGSTIGSFDGTSNPGVLQMLGAIADQNSGLSYDSAASSLTTISQGTGGTVNANIISIDGQSISGNDATLNLKQLNIINSSGSAIVADSTGGYGLFASGTEGIYAQAASPGAGIKAVGSGGPGIEALGDGTSAGIWAKGGLSGHGIQAESGDNTGSGIYAYGIGVGHGIEAKSDNTGSGVYAHSSGVGQGIYGRGGSTTGHGMYLSATGSGAGLYIKGILDDGMKVYGGGNGHGLFLNGAGTGLDISADEIGTPPTIFDGTSTPSIYAMLTAMSDSSGGSDFTSVNDSLTAISIAANTGAIPEIVNSNLVSIDNQAINTNDATLNLKQLNIVNTTGSALVAHSTGGNGHGLDASGNGSGSGFYSGAGATGRGIDASEIGTPPTIFDGTTTPSVYAMLTAMSDSSGGSDFVAVNDSLAAVSAKTGTIPAIVNANLVSIDNQAINTNDATLNLKQLNIVNNAGSAFVAYSTGGNGHGMDASGNGSGSGFYSGAGATGRGIDAAEIGTPPTIFDGTTTPSVYAMLTAMSDSSGGSDFVAVNDSLTAISIAANSDTVLPSVVNANLVSIDNQAINTNDATLNLKQLNIVNTTGSAFVAHSTGGNGHGMDASGNGSGSGFYSGAGATGRGIDASEIGTPPTIFDGTATPSMYAMLTAMSDSSGGSNFTAVNDSLAAISIAANDAAVSGDGTDVNVVAIDGQLTSGNNATLNLKQLNIINNGGTALVARSTGGNGYGIESSGNGTGTGLYVIGGTTGKGAEILGGGVGQIALSVRSTAANAAEILAGTSGIGLVVTGAGTDHGVQFLGGTTSGDGFYVAAQGGNSNGASFHKAGVGKDLDADELDGLLKLTTTVDGQPLSYIYELMMARVNGAYDVDTPAPTDLTMYKRDNVTPLTVVNITPAGRTRTS